MALLTSNTEIITDINKVFAVLEGRMKEPTFRHLLVARFNMVSELTGRIRREIEHVREGRKGRIILKMNGLHDQHMIEELYHASEAGVEIDLIVRGICAWYRTNLIALTSGLLVSWICFGAFPGLVFSE